MKTLTQERLKELLHYNPDTGLFTWKARPFKNFKTLKNMNAWNAKNAYKQAGTLEKNGYIRISIDSKDYRAHRLAWLYFYGIFIDRQIDHINHNTSDNRIINLRLATQGQNNQNQNRSHIDNKSGFLGVSFNTYKNKYFSRIQVERKQYFLGYFNTAIEAHEAYLTAKRKFHEYNTL
jgi:hypothetical protein